MTTQPASTAEQDLGLAASPPPQPSPITGEGAGVGSRFDTVTLIVIAIGVVALVLRMWDLGAKAIHHDESLHATFSWYFAHAAPLYRHDPLMHGPFQFHAMALVFKVFGDSDFTARVPAALSGTALVLTPLLLRRWLGAIGTITAAALLTLSPSLLYYSRFAREDIHIALWTALMMAAVWRYRDDGRDRWLALLAGGLALAFATKESVYLTAAMLLLYCNITLTIALLDQRGTTGSARWWEGVKLAPVAWLVAALWGTLEPWRERLRFTSLPREGDLLVVLGVLTLPQLAAGVQIPLAHLGVVMTAEAEHRIGVLTVSALLGIALVVGMFWDTRRWLIVTAVFYGITIPLFTTGFTNFRGGITSDFWGALDYWIAQQNVRRGEQPWFYYTMMLPLYEFLTLIPAIVGGWWLVERRRSLAGGGLAVLLVSWVVGTFAALTYAGEKMPWLLVHLALPLALLTALVANEVAPRVWKRFRAREGGPIFAGLAGGGTVAIVLLAALSVKVAFGVVYGHPDTPVEPLIYTQTAPDVPRLSKQIHALAKQQPAGTQLQIVVDDSEGASWPWAWYLRDLKGTTYTPAALLATTIRPDGVVLVLPQDLTSAPQLQQQLTGAIPYHHRWWFPEEGYRATTGNSLVKGVFTGRLLLTWAHFELYHRSADHLGALDGDAFSPPGTSFSLPGGSPALPTGPQLPAPR